MVVAVAGLLPGVGDQDVVIEVARAALAIPRSAGQRLAGGVGRAGAGGGGVGGVGLGRGGGLGRLLGRGLLVLLGLAARPRLWVGGCALAYVLSGCAGVAKCVYTKCALACAGVVVPL